MKNLIITLICLSSFIIGQTKQKKIQTTKDSLYIKTNVEFLLDLSSRLNNDYKRKKSEVNDWLNKRGKTNKVITDSSGRSIWIHHIENGLPIFYSTRNIIAAKTTS
ncbi:MAG: hypothetical protein PHW27_09580 [Melioribacteraceae bacterium]|nr:hypothetical protein [Melioribacteraceae bacterium]